MGASDLLVSISQRKLACVIEPALALGSAQGPAFALRLARVFEAWLTRWFWQVLDASDLLARQAECECEPGATLPDARALDAWIAMRDTTDAGGWTLRWLGDSVAESQLRETAQIDLSDRHETLMTALIARVVLAQPGGRGGPAGTQARRPGVDVMNPTLASVDALALSACLDGALILCADDGSGQGDAALPAPVRTLVRANVAAPRVDPGEEANLLTAERDVVRAALAGAGVALLTQTLPRLAAVHVWVDEAGSREPAPAAANDDGDPWQRARAWWYWI